MSSFRAPRTSAESRPSGLISSDRHVITGPSVASIRKPCPRQGFHSCAHQHERSCWSRQLLRALQLCIRSIKRHQLLAAALLDDVHAVHNSDSVSTPHCGEAVRDDKARFAFAQNVKAFLNLLLRDAVQSGSCLVQDQDGRILEEDSRDRDTLLLSAGDRASA